MLAFWSNALRLLIPVEALDLLLVLGRATWLATLSIEGRVFLASSVLLPLDLRNTSTSSEKPTTLN